MTLLRRDFLRVGVIGLGTGWFAPPVAAARARAKACILLYMDGGPSHIDLWDPKPDAPAEVRGPFQPIHTSVPGLRVSECLPRTARVMHHAALVRSVTHHEGVHPPAVFLMLTGRERTSALSRNKIGDGDYPHVGAALAAMNRDRSAMPPFIRLPETMMMDGQPIPGQHAGLLGRPFDPLTVDLDRAGAVMPPPFAPHAEVPATRLAGRTSLLQQFENQRAALETNATSFDLYRQQAVDVLAKPAVRLAFDLEREPPAVRDRYGRHRHGQAVLLARRLVEAGARFITVYWGREQQDWADGVADRVANNPWDGHRNHFPLTRDSLAPRADQALAALLDELHQRGLLETTLVVWMGEFGRTPRITRPWASRDHWPQANSVLLAGAGIRGGQVLGSTDRQGAHVTDSPVSPADLTATMCHAFGVSPRADLPGPMGQAIPVTEGRALKELW